MDCIFCKIIKGEIPSKTLYEDDLVKVIMDVNPVSDGHVLVIPKKHYTDYLELDEDILKHIYAIAKDLGVKFMNKLQAKSLTLLVNYGDAQQVKHFHLHLIPEFNLHDNKTLKSLDEVYDILSK